MATLTPRRPATEADVLTYSRTHGIPVPEPVVKTLVRWNAADARGFSVPIPDGTSTSGVQFLGISGPKHLDLVTVARGSWRRNQAWLFPIAMDAGGNLFAVSTRTSEVGTVWFVDHDTNEATRAFQDVDALVDALVPDETAYDAELLALWEFVRTAPLAEIQARAASENDNLGYMNAAIDNGRKDVIRWLLTHDCQL